ncbi:MULTISPECIES: caspase family protein [Streptomyces]|uniref:caspase family protein n=1 Tax=Streptomyces TaxID=1883 RepID=UPI00292E241F|nr:caspase family protein [Streptomyces sp. NEAU-HV9]
MSDDGTRGPRRFLIATAVGHYPKAPPELEWDRPGLAEARRQVVDLFTRELAYRHVSELGLNPTKDQLLQELRDFCRAADRRPDDIVAVYLAGHGEVLDNGEYVLLTSDTDPDDLYDALLPSTLARKILAGTKVRRLLLMLDTCFSGQGGNELVSAMAKLKNDWREEEAGLAVVTSAQPRELAQTGAFPELFGEAVTSLATAGYSPDQLALDAVVNATRTNPKRPDFQHIGLEIIGLTGEIPHFLPNAKHTPRLSHTDLALQQAAEWDEQDGRRDVEFRTRLLRRAMGHSDEGRVGWWFSGRHRALEDITAWLGELPDERPASVVTGGPGSGKTAILGLLAAVSDPEYRRTVPLASLGLAGRQLPRERAVRTAVYAQNLTDQQVVRALAAALRLPPVESVADLLNHLNAAPEPSRPQVILIDGLDEAVTPETLCGQVLRPLAELAGRQVRLLLGTRPHLLPSLGLRREDHIDLDAPRYADPQAVLAYTVRNLLDAHLDSPYVDCDNDRLRAVARAVAAAAGHSFLVARITAGTLAASRTLPDPQDASWRRSLPRAAADAMHSDLHQRFGADRAGTVLDLLRPLAYAEGQGLPWEDIWAPIASELSGTARYTNQDIHRLRRDAGAYVVEAVEDGRSVYRLYHEAMAEYLRQGQDAAAAHGAFTRALRRAVPYGLDGSRDWGRAHPYALRHLATHAVAAGLLDTVLADPDYLAHADSDLLAPHLLRAESDTARLHAAIYLASIDVHRGLDAEGRRQILAVNAARFNDPTAVAAFNGRLADAAWAPVGASGSQVSGSARHVCVGHGRTVDAVGCAELNGRPIAVSGGWDNTVRIWDLTTGRAVGEPLTGHNGKVRALGCTELEGRPVAVTASDDRTVRIWDLAAGRPVGEPLTGHRDSVKHLSCAELEGRPIAVTGSDDGTVRVWDLTSGRPVGAPIPAADAVSTLTCGVLHGRPVAVVASAPGRLRVWDLVSRKDLGALPDERYIWPVSLACTTLGDRPVVVGGTHEGKLHIWDLETHRHLAEWQGQNDWTPSLVCTVLDGRTVAIAAAGSSGVQIWDLSTHQQVEPSLRGHTYQVQSVALSTTTSGEPVAVTGSIDGTVRVWDLSPRQVVGSPVDGHTNRIGSMDLTTRDDRPVLLTGSMDSTVRAWDLATCLPLRGIVRGGSVSCSVLDGHPVAVTSDLGDLMVWDIGGDLITSRRVPFNEPLQGHACTVLDGRPVAVGVSSDSQVWMFDCAAGEFEILFTLDRPDNVVRPIVTFTVLDGRQVAVIGSIDETLWIWDLAARHPIADLRVPGYRGGPLVCTTLDERPVAVTAAKGNAVQVLDLATRRAVARPMTGHTDYVTALACAELDGRAVAASGSRDGMVRIWDLQSGSASAVIRIPGRCQALALHESGYLACAFGNDVAVFARR